MKTRRSQLLLGLLLFVAVPLEAQEPFFRWSSAGRIDGLHCTRINEPSEPGRFHWDDNFLCSDQDWGLRWSFAGRIDGMRCTRINEPSEPPRFDWDDNFLCVPPDSPLLLQWSFSGPIDGLQCVQFRERSEPRRFDWHDNFLCFTLDTEGDADEDGLLDAWEIVGLDINNDGAVDLDLPSLGANPRHKDIFVEIDYLDCKVAGGDCSSGDTHSHHPKAEALALVVKAFANAPVLNPDGTTGIKLHIGNKPEPVSHRLTCSFENECFDSIKSERFGTAAERTSDNAANILAAKRLVYHYALWVHNSGVGPRRGRSGDAESPGNDLIVSLGSWTDLTVFGEAGTFMHELGHNLGLDHGGNDFLNCKPNYLSVMSYTFQTEGLKRVERSGQITSVLDYSRAILPPLDETNLNEPVGIQDGAFLTFYGPPANLDGVDNGADGDLTDDWLVGTGTGPIDWNNDGNNSEMSSTADINNLEIERELGGQCSPSLGQPALNGFDDWANLWYDFRLTGNFQDGVHEGPPSNRELDVETARKIGAQIQRALTWYLEGGPDLRIEHLHVQPPTARPGETLSVEFEVANVGSETAPGSFQGGYMVDLVLSTDQHVPPGFAIFDPSYREDVLLRGGRFSNTSDLDPAETVSFGDDNNGLPADTPPGSYFVCAVVDPGTKVAETQEGNNVICTPLIITDHSGGPDLRIERLRVQPPTARPGETLSVEFEVVNVGSETAPGSFQGGYMVDLVLSTDQHVPPGFAIFDPSYREDVLLRGGRFSNTSDLDPAETVSFGDNNNGLPADTPPGSYFVCAVVDPGTKVAETQEGNNVICTPLIIHS